MEKRKNLVLFTGNSPAKLRAELSRWMALFESKYGAESIVRISEDFPPESVVTELLSLPFFVEKRLVVFEGIPKAKKKPGKKAETKSDGSEPLPDSDAPESKFATGDSADRIERAVVSVFATIPESTVAVFVSPDADTNSELFKLLSREADVKRFDAYDAVGADTYVRERLPGIEPPARRLLVARTAGDDLLLCDAVERLSLAYGDSRISERNVEEVVSGTVESDVFAFSDAVAALDFERTLALFRRAVEKDSPRKIFPTMMGEIRKTLYVSALREAGLESEAIRSCLDMKSSWAIEKRPRLPQMAEGRLFSLYERLVEFDAGTKTGTVPGPDENEMFENGIARAIIALRKNEKR